MNANTIDKVWRTGIREVNFVIYELKQIQWEWKLSMQLEGMKFTQTFLYICCINWKLVEKIFKCPVSCISWFILYIHGQYTNFHLFDYPYKLCVYVLPLLFHIVKYDRVIIDASAKTNDFEIHHMNVCSCHRSGNWSNSGGSYVPEWSLSYKWSLKGTKNVRCFVFQKVSAGFVHVAMYLLRIDWKIAIIAVSWPFVRNEMETFCIPFQLRK